MLVRRLSQQTFVPQFQADIPSRLAVLGLDDHSVQQTLAPHFLHHVRMNLFQFLAEHFAQRLRILCQMLVTHHLQGCDGHLRRNGIAAVGGTMLARLDAQHDIVICQHAGHRHHATRYGLPQNQDIRTHPLVVTSQQLPRAGNARLHLVRHEKDIVRLAQIISLFQIPLCRDINACLALNRLYQETCHVRVFQRFRQGRNVIIRYLDESGRKRPIAPVSLRVVGQRDNRYRPPVEIPVANDDFSLPVRDAFLQVRPFAAKFQCRLVRLRAGVHRQHLVITEILRHKLLPFPQDIVVESPRRQRQLLRLVCHRLDNLGMAMPLVHCRIG